jgi:hypothetical protein
MENIFSSFYSGLAVKKFLFNVLAVLVIYFIPAISHLINFPLYLFDPMRMAVIFSIIFTSKKNTVLLAFSLPVFSFIVSGHPYFLKSLLIASELTFNVYLFYIFYGICKKYFWSMLGSILAAKLFYYSIKYILISVSLIESSLITTSLMLQLSIAMILSIILDIAMVRQNQL